VGKLNICFIVVFLIKEINLKFADMRTYETFKISNIYLIQVTYNMLFVCVYIQKKMFSKYYLFQVK